MNSPTDTIITLIDNTFQDQNIGGYSTTWANWESKLTPSTCFQCAQNHGKIFDISIFERHDNKINAHSNCKCEFKPMRIKVAGTSTDMGIKGPDLHLALFYKLPKYYITKSQAEDNGWIKWKGNLDNVLPGRVIGGDIYQNKEKKLPIAPNRIWYEADINYFGGYRSRDRMLYSNDGLIFISYDHYQTFYELVR